MVYEKNSKAKSKSPQTKAKKSKSAKSKLTTLSSALHNVNKHSKCKIELHLHLDGSARAKTIFELAQKKGIKLTPKNTLEDFEQFLTIVTPKDLPYFLSKFEFIRVLVGDLKAIERISFELCQDEASEQVLYFEARYSPHIFSNTVKHYYNPNPVREDDPSAVTPKDAVLAVARGFDRGMRMFDIKVSQILCLLKGNPNWGNEVLALAKELGSTCNIVGIDIAGDESVNYSEEEIRTFVNAKKLGIHRTAHAGEAGPASNVEFAIQKLWAERIGHGYHVLDDEKIYRMCIENGVHFETCPYSSYLTGAVKRTVKHPIVTFAEDEVSFSINKDDSLLTRSTLQTECRLLYTIGLSEVHIVRANFNALRAAFLPESQKKCLFDRLVKAYGCYW